jgi:hypothetical protein
MTCRSNSYKIVTANMSHTKSLGNNLNVYILVRVKPVYY